MLDQYQKMARLREQVNFLGYEFLTWLFLFLNRRESEEEITRITKEAFKTPVTIVLGGKIITCLFDHKEQKTSITCPILDDSHEVFASIKNGHLVDTLSIAISFAEIKVGFQIHATDFAITQAKISNNYEGTSLHDEEDLDEDEANREEIFLRTAALDDAERVLDSLYKHFLTIRLDGKAYMVAVRTMREQIEERLAHYLRREIEYKDNLAKDVHANN